MRLGLGGAAGGLKLRGSGSEGSLVVWGPWALVPFSAPICLGYPHLAVSSLTYEVREEPLGWLAGFKKPHERT